MMTTTVMMTMTMMATIMMMIMIMTISMMMMKMHWKVTGDKETCGVPAKDGLCTGTNSQV